MYQQQKKNSTFACWKWFKSLLPQQTKKYTTQILSLWTQYKKNPSNYTKRNGISKSLIRRASSSFKHNASFVARLPTIRRHKSQSLHSPAGNNLKPTAGSGSQRGRNNNNNNTNPPRPNEINNSAENLGNVRFEDEDWRWYWMEKEMKFILILRCDQQHWPTDERESLGRFCRWYDRGKEEFGW